jgi:hypothetical protein
MDDIRRMTEPDAQVSKRSSAAPSTTAESREALALPGQRHEYAGQPPGFPGGSTPGAGADRGFASPVIGATAGWTRSNGCVPMKVRSTVRHQRNGLGPGLYTLGVLGWFMLATLPMGGIAFSSGCSCLSFIGRLRPRRARLMKDNKAASPDPAGQSALVSNCFSRWSSVCQCSPLTDAGRPPVFLLFFWLSPSASLSIQVRTPKELRQ